ncbi:putative protein kinase [Tilletia horrida]|uniref:Uncharacterized protein n=1 Tax=Tilletia horrida TaxID=155126 RepID=A0AAN6JQ82_9BASI|nr:putative protein kinase [Tilletia horrida]KAK0547974.1 putative protein kinase [Tilletia horrida]KAK0561735.1 putative protein kinase [Tilletia horrida]
MDIPAITSLLSTSTSSLAALHAKLGHPADKLQQALALLAETVRTTVDAQVATLREQVEQVEQECEEYNSRLRALKTAMGTEDAPTSKARKSGKKSQDKDTADEALLVRRDRLVKEVQKSQKAYDVRCHKVDTLLERIDQFSPMLEGGSTADMSEDAVMVEADADSEDPEVPPLPVRTNVAIANTAANTPAITTSAAYFTPQTIPIATTSYINALTAHLNGLHALHNARAQRFQAYLQHIFDLWGSLHVRPNVESDAFERSICRAAGVMPLMEAVQAEDEDGQTGETENSEKILFRGHFRLIAASELEGGEEEDATAVLIMAQDETPMLLPSVTTLRRLRTLIQILEEEKLRREERIQQLYDELFVLWSRFDCDESDMDEFVMEHKGLSLEAIAAYEAELEKMVGLKAQHSLTFITRIRAQMEQYRKSARLTQEECEATWPEFFTPLPDANAAASNDSTEPPEQSAYDGLLEAHEEAIPKVLALLEAKAPIMRLVERYEELCKEEEELAESAKNTSRLFAGAKKGGNAGLGSTAEKPKRDPGRLLREEKMRKRVKLLKPKLEAEMLKAIPEWEQQHGQAFTMDGERYFDKLEAAAASRRPASSIPPVSGSSSSASLAGQKLSGLGSDPTGAILRPQPDWLIGPDLRA